MRHRNVLTIQLLFFDVQRNTWFIQTEFHKSRLDDKLKDISLTLDQFKHLVKGVILGLLHVHDHGVLHRDLAARNILVSEKDDAIIADFDCAVDPQAAPRTSRFSGEAWRAPEVASGRLAEPNRSSDLFSLGVLIRFMCAQWEKRHGRDGLSPLERMASELMAEEPGKRPSTADLLAHDFFNSRPEEIPEGKLDDSKLARLQETIENNWKKSKAQLKRFSLMLPARKQVASQNGISAVEQQLDLEAVFREFSKFLTLSDRLNVTFLDEPAQVR